MNIKKRIIELNAIILALLLAPGYISIAGQQSPDSMSNLAWQQSSNNISGAAGQKFSDHINDAAGQKSSNNIINSADQQLSARESNPADNRPANNDSYSSVHIYLNPQWQFAEYSEINSGYAVLYKAIGDNRKNYTVGLNAGHGTKGGTEVRTYCHPDKTPKVTGGSTAEGSLTATAVSYGMVFPDGTTEADAVFKVADLLREKLLAEGFDVLMIRDGEDVQLDNVARTVICNNMADCHIAIHFDSDALDYDKGCFYISVPDELKYMEHVAAVWESSESLGEFLVNELADSGFPVYAAGNVDLDLTQTSYSTIPSVDIELGNEHSDISDEAAELYAEGLFRGIKGYIKAGLIIHESLQGK